MDQGPLFNLTKHKFKFRFFKLIVMSYLHEFGEVLGDPPHLFHADFSVIVDVEHAENLAQILLWRPRTHHVEHQHKFPTYTQIETEINYVNMRSNWGYWFCLDSYLKSMDPSPLASYIRKMCFSNLSVSASG